MRRLLQSMSQPSASQLWFAACTALILSVAVTACDTGGSAQESDPALDGPSAALLDDIDLTPKQKRQLSSGEATQDTTPGRLWRRSAKLQTVLTDAQKERLFTRWREHRAERRDRRERDGRRARVVRRLRRLAAGLDLTSEQKKSLREVLRHARSSYQSLLAQRTEGGVPLDSVRAFRTDVRDQITAILSAEQLQSWKDRRTRRKQRRKEAKAVRRDVLALSSDQRASMKRLLAERRTARRALHERFWGGQIDRPEQRRRLREARKEFRSRAAEVLSTRQVEIIRLHRILRASLLHKKSDR